MGGKRAEKPRERVEERWGEIRGKRWGESKSGRVVETWGEKEDWGGREAGRGRVPRRSGETEEDTGKWQRRNQGTQHLELVGFPEVRGIHIPMWSQPSSSSMVSPRGFEEKKEEAAVERRSWRGWASQGSSPHPPETSLTRLPRMQQEVETLCSSTTGNPSMHREAGTEPCECVCVCVGGVGGGQGGFPSSVHCVVTLACSVALSESLAYQRAIPDSDVDQIPGWHPLALRSYVS